LGESICKTRSHWVDAARNSVGNYYNLHGLTAHQCASKARELLKKKSFAGRIKTGTDGKEHIAYFNNPVVWTHIRGQVLKTPRSIGRRHLTKEFFRPIRPQTIFFACTAIYCAINMYTINGVRPKLPPMFTYQDHKDIYIEFNETWKKVTIKSILVLKYLLIQFSRYLAHKLHS
jgi:hypothetical protein